MGKAHFGKTLESLREARGLSRTDLAAEAGMDTSSIFRAEQREQCNLRPSNVKAITDALAKSAPFTESEAQQWAAGTGIARYADTVRKLHESGHTWLVLLTQAYESMPAPRMHAHMMVEDLLDNVGEVRVLDLLRGMASFAGLPIGPVPTQRPARRNTKGG
ncbi:MAG: helix-turn-helix domain-containing protein [Phycisphaerales bacterium]|nr:helix-turn-helix domain-containing protein [Phycisphaerales bacterium]